jgi:hypothetical protein
VDRLASRCIARVAAKARALLLLGLRLLHGLSLLLAAYSTDKVQHLVDLAELALSPLIAASKWNWGAMQPVSAPQISPLTCSPERGAASITESLGSSDVRNRVTSHSLQLASRLPTGRTSRC